MYALLLFGGPVSVNHVRGGLSIGNEDGYIKVQAIPRIGILVNQLRYLANFLGKLCEIDNAQTPF